jgi:hypothetical protein
MFCFLNAYGERCKGTSLLLFLIMIEKYSCLDPLEVFSVKRLDIASRTPLVRSLVEAWSPIWALELYREVNEKLHVNNWNEPPKANSIDYVVSFFELINSIRSNGFDFKGGAIPIKDGIPLNGAHRLAASLVLGNNISTVEMDSPAEIQDISFLSQIGVADSYLDAMVTEFVDINPYIRAFIILGVSDGSLNSVCAEIENEVPILAIKNFPLSEIGKRRVVDLMYSHNPWWNFNQLEKFVNERFSDGQSHASLVLYDSRFSSDIIQLKLRARARLGDSVFDRLIHGSDFHLDTQILVRTIFSKSGLDFLNNSPIGSELRIMNTLGGIDFSLNRSPAVLIGSACLELYGLRDARDLDYLQLEGRSTSDIGNILARSNESCYSVSKDSLILDPRLSVTYKNLRFLALPALSLYKLDRGESKDFSDINLVSNRMTSTHSLYFDRHHKKEAFVVHRAQKWGKFVQLIWSYTPEYLKKLARATMVRPIRRYIRNH